MWFLISEVLISLSMAGSWPSMAHTLVYSQQTTALRASLRAWGKLPMEPERVWAGFSLLLVELFIQETFPEHQWCLDSWVTCLKIQWWKAPPLPSRSLRWSWRQRKEHRQFKHGVRSTTSGVNSGGKVRQGADHWGPGKAFGEIKSKPDLKI